MAVYDSYGHDCVDGRSYVYPEEDCLRCSRVGKSDAESKSDALRLALQHLVTQWRETADVIDDGCIVTEDAQQAAHLRECADALAATLGEKE